MKNGYTELEIYSGSLESVVNKLLKHHKNGEKACFNFNGHELYSDEVTMDSAYLKVLGQTKAKNDKYHEELNNRYEKEKREHEESIPELTKHWMKEAIDVLEEKKLKYWGEIVPIRLGDLYRGMELGCTLDIAKSLNNGVDYFQEAKEKLNNQSHSGMSYGLMMSMIKEFCRNGKEFVEYLK